MKQTSLFQKPDSLLLCIISQKPCSTSCGVGVCSISRVKSDASAISRDLLLKQTQTWQAPQPVLLLSSVPGQWPLSSSLTCTDKNFSTRTFPNRSPLNMTIDIQPSPKTCSNQSRWKQPVNSALLQKQKLPERWFDGLCWSS